MEKFLVQMGSSDWLGWFSGTPFFFFFIAYVVVGVEPNPQTVALLD
jgi:hypothetical protein